MSFNSTKDARDLLGLLMDQPKKFLYGVDQAIFNSVMAMITPIPRDGDSEKEWAQAHVYLLDLPGRGKSALLKSLTSAVKAKMGRIDGRIDMMPSDLVGREDVDRFTGIRTLLKGPIHSNVFFFDEINRTPAKGQGILLGAMEGGYVVMNVTDLENKRIDSRMFPLYPISEKADEKENYFIVMATANPIELVGTNELSEAQKERFTYSLRTGLPKRVYEMLIRSENVMGKKIEQVMDLKTLLEISDLVKKVTLSAQAHEYIQRLIENSRPISQDLEEEDGYRPRKATSDLIQFVDRYVASGCSPRRNYHMQAAAKAWAFMNGDDNVATADDVRSIASITMEHVLLLQPRSLGDNITARTVVKKIIEQTAELS